MKQILLAAALSIIANIAISQPPCGFDILHQKQLKSDPEYARKIKENETRIKNYILRHPFTAKPATTLYTIPVVVHVMHTGGTIGSAYNPSDAQINGTIDYLNQVYNGTYPGMGGVGDLQIQFELAKRTPSATCTATNGIDRVDASSLPSYTANGVNFVTSNGCPDLTLKNLARWNPTDYYNIWIVNKIDGWNGSSGSGYAGYAQFPGASSSVDGAVVLAAFFSAGSKLLPHEIGHGLNLYHPFQGSSNYLQCPSNSNCSSDGDMVCDTDPITYNYNSSTGWDFSCRTGTNMCTGSLYNDNTESNFMNYTNCYTLFTNGQKTRMLAAMSLPERASLVAASNMALVDCVTPSCTSAPPNNTCGNAILLDATTPCKNGTTCLATPISPSNNITQCIVSPSTAKDVWYKFVATSSSATINVQSLSGFNAVVQVLSQVTCASFYNQVDCVDNTGGGGLETVNLTGLVIGSTYHVRIYDYAGSTGDFQICLTLTAPCSNPIPLTCNQPYNGTTSGGSSNISSYSCSSSWNESGPEIIHVITTTITGDITATLTNLNDDLDVFILSSCSTSSCEASGNNSATYSNAPAGTYYIVVDGYQGAVGSYTLIVDCPVPVLDCNAATPLVCGQPYSGTTAGANSNVSVYNCQSGWNESGAERVHVITTTTSGDITATLTNLGSNDLDVFILSSCSASACEAGGDNSATYTNAPAGTYYIVVEGYQGAAGSYTLTVDCPGLDCSSAFPMVCGVPFSGSTVGGTNLISTYSCQPLWDESGSEQVFKITTTITSDITATLTNIPNDLDVFILSNCDPASCLAAGDIFTTYQNAPPGTYYIVVDGYNGASGGFTLTVNCSTPPLDCSGSTTMSCGQSFSGTTVGAASNVTFYGNLTVNESGPEKVHKITLNAPATITATLTNLSTINGDLDVFILNSCDANALKAWDDNIATYANAPAGTYYIVVDGFSGQSGNYTLTTSCSALPLKLLSFNGVVYGIDVRLRWKTAQEVNMQKYEIQRSLDSRQFIAIGAVQSLNSAFESYYDFTDANVFVSARHQGYYYRLKQINQDGSYTYSSVVFVKKGSDNNYVQLVNTVFNNSMNIQTSLVQAEKVNFQITDYTGREVYNKTLTIQAGNGMLSLIDLPILSRGYYILKIIREQNISADKVFRQ